MKKTIAWSLAALLAGAVAPAWAQTATSPLKKPAPAAAAPAATAPAKPAAAAPATPEAKPASAAQQAQRNKMKACGAEWQTMKKAGKTQGKSWREFSSECLKKG